MPNAQLTPEQVQDEAEKLFLEQAKAYYRGLRQAAQSAPVGKMIAQADVQEQSVKCRVKRQHTLHFTLYTSHSAFLRQGGKTVTEILRNFRFGKYGQEVMR